MQLLTSLLSSEPRGTPAVFLCPRYRPPRLAIPELTQGGFPGRGLLYSFLVHEVAIVALLVHPAINIKPRVVPAERQWEMTILSSQALFLPRLRDESRGSNNNAGPNGGAARDAHSDRLMRAGAITFVGPQEIVSNPPSPTNHIQTILQPQIPNPPILKMVLPVPNIVALAPDLPEAPPRDDSAGKATGAKSVEPRETVAAKITPAIVIPTIRIDGPQPLENSQLTLPRGEPNYAQAALPPIPDAAEPAPESVTKTTSTIKAASQSKSAAPAMPLIRLKATRSLLALSPITFAHARSDVPQGEARGLFSISPFANAELHNPGVGSSQGDARAGTAGIPNLSSLPGDRNESGNGAAGAGGVAGGSGRTGRDGRGTGLGSDSGTGTGTGTGSGNGNSSGAGNGDSEGPFPGMSIQGAEGPAGAITIQGSSPAPGRANTIDSSYGLTVISIGNSGGGVQDFGVFRNEAVFTVYVKPTRGSDAVSTAWALQYALLDRQVVLRDLVPPVVTQGPAPEWPSELASRYRDQEFVVFAVIAPEGKLQDIKILQSPNANLEDVLLITLKRWVFQPAMMNGAAVAVKAVLGIPVSLN